MISPLQAHIAVEILAGCVVERFDGRAAEAPETARIDTLARIGMLAADHVGAFEARLANGAAFDRSTDEAVVAAALLLLQSGSGIEALDAGRAAIATVTALATALKDRP